MQYKVLGETFSLWAIVGYLVNMAPAVAGIFAIIYYYYAIQEKRLNIKTALLKKQKRKKRDHKK